MSIPIHNRMGVVIAHLIVDDEDAKWANQYRWALNSNGYAWRSIMGGTRHQYLHRELLGLERGDGRQADHANHDKLDNRRSNLRIATPAQNRQNTPALGGTSRYRGVCWDKARGKWAARVQLDGRQHHVGRFDSESAAARAASDYRRKHMPFSEDAA